MAVEVNETDAAEYNLSIKQGIDFVLTTFWRDETDTLVAGLENWTGRMQIRARVESEEVLVDLTTENGGLELGNTLGEVTIKISDTDTDTYSWYQGVYDMELVDTSGRVYPYLEGTVSVRRSVTR